MHVGFKVTDSEKEREKTTAGSYSKSIGKIKNANKESSRTERTARMSP